MEHAIAGYSFMSYAVQIEFVCYSCITKKLLLSRVILCTKLL